MKQKDSAAAKEATPVAQVRPDQGEAVAAMRDLNTAENPLDGIPADFDPAKVQDIAKAREEAKIPEHKKAGELLDRELVFVSWRPQSGTLRSTGEIRPGFFCVCMDVQTKKVFTIWIGQVALYKELKKLKPPFRAKITVSGRTLVFS